MPSSNDTCRDAAIEVMLESDLDQVEAIEREAFSTPWPRDSFRYELRNPRAHNLVARVGTEVVGYVCVWLVAGELKINNVAVRCDRRGRGLGARLLEAVLDLARVRGCTEATLEVRPSNTEARALYERFGFREVGRRKRYYPDSGEDAVLMTLDLP
jgi:ribosomal-protein-alanine N-acetyltransferase